MEKKQIKRYRKFESIKNEFLAIFHETLRMKMPFSYMLERERSLMDSDDYKRLKGYEKSYIQGIRAASLNFMYVHLQWAFTYDGKYVENLPYGDGFKPELIQESFHHYKGFPDRKFD